MRKKQPSTDPNEKLKIEAAMELGLLERLSFTVGIN